MTQYALQHPFLAAALTLVALIVIDNTVCNVCRAVRKRAK